MEPLLYTCDKCFTTIHADCILGRHPYMKPGHKIKVNGLEIQIVSNNVVSRQPCHTCQCICEDKVVFINRINIYIFVLWNVISFNAIKTTGDLSYLLERWCTKCKSKLLTSPVNAFHERLSLKPKWFEFQDKNT